MLTQIGAMLSNEAVCEVMQSCFRICFEMRLSGEYYYQILFALSHFPAAFENCLIRILQEVFLK